MSGRLPWSKFNWNDWDTDPALALCSMAAQGFWMRLLCICAKEDGYLRVGGEKPTDEDLAFVTRQPVEKVSEWLAELERRGVFSRARGGVIYSRRMVADLKTSAKNQANGKRGGNPSLRKDTDFSASLNPSSPDPVKAEEEEEERREDNPPTPLEGGQGEAPIEGKDNDGVTPAESGRRKPKRAIPAGCPDADAIARQQQKARDSGVNVDAAYHAERFRNWAVGKDARYADWDATWNNWMARTIKEAPPVTGGASLAVVAAPQDRWCRAMLRFQRSAYWDTTDDGPKPGKPGCEVPADILAEFGFAPTPNLPFTQETRRAS